MDTYGDDIAKYHEGRLTPAERHALEKKALSDPFLADALEGAGQIPPDEFTKDVASLLSKTRGGAKPLFTPMRIAASVILLVGTAWIALYLSNDDDESKLLTQNEQKPVPQASEAAKDSSTAPAEAPAQGGEQVVEPKKDQLLSLNKPKNQGKESGGPATRDGEPKPGAIDPIEQETKLTEAESIADSGQVLTDFILQDKVSQQPVESQASRHARAAEEVQVATERSKTAAAARAEAADALQKEPRAGVARMSDADDKPGAIRGRVTLAEDGIALPGVNVSIKGSSAGTVTDLNGAYSIEAGQEKPTLIFSFIGLETKEVASSPGTTVDVALNDDVSQLSEVVVTGKKIPMDLDAEPVVKLAAPVGGLRAYDNYLYDNLTYPQQALDSNVKGRVMIQFTVGIDGSLNEFTVMKSLGFGCDEEVIRLVKQGPKWNPTTENDIAVESLVRVRMKFDAAKEKRK